MNGSNHQFNLFQDGTEDRIRALEQRVEMQDDEIALLKSSMADILRRLSETESMQQRSNNFVRKPIPIKSQFTPLPSRPAVESLGTPRQRPTAPPPSSPGTRRRSSSSSSRGPSSMLPSDASKANGASGDIKRTGSTEQIFTRNGKRASFGKSSARQRPRPTTPSYFKESSYNAEEGTIKIYLKGRPVVLHCPTTIEESYDISKSLDAPEKKLKLDWVYGYRGKDCRSNLYILPTGEMVFFVAAVVVLYDPKEGLQRHYLGHNDDVKCLAVHPDKLKIATGQVAGLELDGREFKGRNICAKPRQPHIRVWDAVSLNTLHVIGMGEFNRSVACINFSKMDGGVHLCAIDESNDHVLTLWEWEKEAKLAETKTSKDQVVACEFNPHTEELQIVSCGKSHILFWKLDDGNLVKKQGLFEKHEKPKYILCLGFTKSGVPVSGDSNGNIHVWTTEGVRRIERVISNTHDGAILSMCVLRDGSFVTGGKDSKLIKWDADFNKVAEYSIPNLNSGGIRTVTAGNNGDTLLVGTKKNSILCGNLQSGFETLANGHVEELWGLATHPTKQQFLTGAYDKTVMMWDADTHMTTWTKTLDDPIQSAEFYPLGDGAVVAVAMATGRWLVLDSATGDLVTVHTDGCEQHDVITYSKDGNYLAIGSHDNNIYIYAVSDNGRKYQKQGKCVGHSSFITHIDWSVDGHQLQSNSGDYEILYWDARSCKQITSASSMRDVEWASNTCTLNFNTFGVWPEGADGTDVNTVCRSHDSAYLASGDDFGKVHLYKYPCNKPKAPSSKHSGHSSHVTCVRFLPDDETVLSTGGQDCGILQWKIV